MFQRTRKASDFGAEIEAHIALETERLQEQGLSDEDARTEARRRFGNVTRVQERFYEASRWPMWDHFQQDVRYAARMLRKSPGFTAIAVLTIALGIGATTAIFSVVDATLLRPLLYPHPEQLVSVVDDLPGVGARDVGMSVPEWHDFARSGIFEYVSPTGGGDVNVTGSSEPTRILFETVGPNYFALLGVPTELGRAFDPEDQTPGFTLEVVISDALWKGAFGGDPRILDRDIRLDNDLYRIVGVMPASFRDPGQTSAQRGTQLWAAAGFAGPPAPEPLRASHFLAPVIARIKPGLTISEAQSRLDALVGSLQKEYPRDYPLQSAWRVRLVPLKQAVVGDVRQSLILLLGAVGLVLLIGCVNVANLLLARASSRGREMAVRQALGAERKRLMWQLLTEGLLLSLLGGVVGLVILYCAKGFLLQIVPERLPRLNEVTINWPALLFALLATLLAGAIFGLAPAWHAARPDLTRMLKQEGRGSSASREQARTRRALVISEFALSLVLMIAAGLLLRSFADLLQVQLGYNPQNVMAVRTWLPIPNDPATDIYRTPALQAPFLREVLRRGRTLPGVEEIAVGNVEALPLGHERSDLNLYPLIINGRETPSSEAPLVDGAIVTPGYFHLLGMTLLRGRLFGESDNESAPPVVVINEAFARTYWPNENPVGQRIKLRTAGDRASLTWNTVVGVIADARTESLADASAPRMYMSLYQRTAKDWAIFVRGQLDTAAIPVQLRAQVQSVDPELPVFGARTLSDVFSASLAERRFSMEIVGLFALTALLLAALGIYGVISYIVSERTHEIGIRLALGAQRHRILQMILSQGLGLAIAGAAIGLVGAVIVAHLMAGVLYGVRPTDPVTFVSVALLLIAVALLACYIPARRAIRVDPLVALRYE